MTRDRVANCGKVYFLAVGGLDPSQREWNRTRSRENETRMDVTLKNSKVHAYLQIRQKWIMKMDNADIDNESENTGSDIKNKRFSGKTHNLIYYSDLIFTILLNYQCSPCPHHRIFGSGVSVGARLEGVRIEGGLVEEHSVSLGFFDCVHCFGVGVPCDLVRIVYGDVSWFVEGCSDFVDEDGFEKFN